MCLLLDKHYEPCLLCCTADNTSIHSVRGTRRQSSRRKLPEGVGEVVPGKCAVGMAGAQPRCCRRSGVCAHHGCTFATEGLAPATGHRHVVYMHLHVRRLHEVRWPLPAPLGGDGR